MTTVHRSSEPIRSAGLILALAVSTSLATPNHGAPGRLAPHAAASSGFALSAAGAPSLGAVRPSSPPVPDTLVSLRLPSAQGRPKIAFSFNPEDDLTAIRRAGFTHILVSYLQGAPDEEQRRKLDDCQRHGLKLIYRLVDLVDQARRSGSDSRLQHAVTLARDHPALAGWQTFEETNLPPQTQIAYYRKIKRWDPRHPVIIIVTNEYSPGWYRRTYSDEAQDIVMIDYYPYKRGYDGWPYIRMSVPALRAAQKRPMPLIPIIQASSSGRVASAEDTTWPPPGGLEKQVNYWWTLGADAGVACWVWRGSKDYPFIGLADLNAPPYALSETTALLTRIPDGELAEEQPRPPEPVLAVASPHSLAIPAVRIWQPRVNYLKNSGFEQGLEAWVGYNEIAVPASEAYAGHGAARMANAGAPKAIGVGQQTDLLVPPNATVTFSAYYKVVRETTLLQWMINTTAYPKFGAADFLERKERLPPGDWQRSAISGTNTTGDPQRVTGVSIISNGFTGDVLLDNFQLELAPQASAYADGTHSQTTRLRFDLSAARLWRTPPGRGREWTLAAWSAPEMPPAEGSYACLAAIVPAHPTLRGRPPSPTLELRLRVDPRRSDQYGWVGALELAGDRAYLRMPIAMAPGQPVFWALCGDRDGRVTLRAALAGYRLASVSAAGVAPGVKLRSVVLGSDADGGHPLNGLTGGGRFLPRALSLPEAEQLR